MRPSSPPVRWLLSSSGRTAVQLAGVSGAGAVALGAYGAHKLRAGDHNPELVQVRHRRHSGRIVCWGRANFRGNCRCHTGM